MAKYGFFLSDSFHGMCTGGQSQLFHLEVGHSTKNNVTDSKYVQ